MHRNGERVSNEEKGGIPWRAQVRRLKMFPPGSAQPMPRYCGRGCAQGCAQGNNHQHFLEICIKLISFYPINSHVILTKFSLQISMQEMNKFLNYFLYFIF
jgi:hypothetical protein